MSEIGKKEESGEKKSLINDLKRQVKELEEKNSALEEKLQDTNTKYLDVKEKLQKLSAEIPDADLLFLYIKCEAGYVFDLNEIPKGEQVRFTIPFRFTNPEIRGDLVPRGFEEEFKRRKIQVTIDGKQIPFRVISTEETGRLNRTLMFEHRFEELGKHKLEVFMERFEMITRDLEVINLSIKTEVKVFRRGGSRLTSAIIHKNDGKRLVASNERGNLINVCGGINSQSFVNDPLYILVKTTTQAGPVKMKNVCIKIHEKEDAIPDFIYTFKESEWSEELKGFVTKGIALPKEGHYAVLTPGLPKHKVREQEEEEEEEEGESLRIVVPKRIRVRFDGDTDQVKNLFVLLAQSCLAQGIIGDFYDSQVNLDRNVDLQFHLCGRALAPLVDDHVLRSRMERLVEETTTRSAIYVHLVPKMGFRDYSRNFGDVKIHARDRDDFRTFRSVLFFQRINELFDDVFCCMDRGEVVTDVEHYSVMMQQMVELVGRVNEEVQRRR